MSPLTASFSFADLPAFLLALALAAVASVFFVLLGRRRF